MVYVATPTYEEKLVYVYTGVIDSIHLTPIEEGETVVIVRNNTRYIYKSLSYNTALYSMINRYGLGENEAIDPSLPTPDSAIPLEDIEYYTVKLITNDTIVPNGALIVKV
jgi:hypothetical protein